MRPNQHQKLLLQQYLSENLKYRETFAEFYDHILSALEAKSVDSSFEDSVWKIINEDFGGAQGMRLIEDKYQQAIFVEMRRKYIANVVENIKLPWIILLITFGVFAYYFVRQPGFTFPEFLLLLFAVRIVPNLLHGVIRLKSPYIYGSPKRSVKRGFAKWLNFIPGVIICAWLCSVPGFFTNNSHLETTSPNVMAGLLVLIAIHSLTVYRLYRNDLKIRFTIN
jgi:hypothetical protein